MNRKSIFRYILQVMALCSFFVCWSHLAQAQTGTTVTIQLEDYDTILTQLGQDTEGHQLKVWKLPAPYTYSERQQIVDKLHDLDEATLDQTFETAQFPMVFAPDGVKVSGLPDGLYYIRYLLRTPQVSYPSEFVFAVGAEYGTAISAKKIAEVTSLLIQKTDEAGNPLEKVGFTIQAIDPATGNLSELPLVDGYRYDSKGASGRTLYTDKNGHITIVGLPKGRYRLTETNPLPGYRLVGTIPDVELVNNQQVTITVVNQKDKVGDYSFIKVDAASKNKLAGAVFKVTQVVNGNYKPVIQNGKELVLTSNSEGRFSVQGLPYGTYQLWETKAPAGYVQLNEPLSFTIDANQTRQVTVVENRKRPGIDVPNTGDFTLYLLMVVAAVLLLVGRQFARSKA